MVISRCVRTQDGFIAALDQSGGSTPKALLSYGVEESEYSGDEEMFTKVHEMRTRIITSSAFNGDRILGAILFENTMDREICGKGSAQFLWEDKRVVPFLKVDKGLADEADGVQLMKPIPGLDDLLARAKSKGVFGTKMRSVIKSANASGVKAIVEQQFEIGKQIIAAGLIPIIEPEVDINAPAKAEAEAAARAAEEARVAEGARRAAEAMAKARAEEEARVAAEAAAAAQRAAEEKAKAEAAAAPSGFWAVNSSRATMGSSEELASYSWPHSARWDSVAASEAL